MKNRVQCIFFTSDIVLTGVSRVLFMPASKNNLKLKNIFSSFFFKFRKGIVFSTFWSQKSISENVFSQHDKWTAAFLHIKFASKVLEKNTFFIIKMASESDFKTIQQLTCFVMKNRVQCIFFTSDNVSTNFAASLYLIYDSSVICRWSDLPLAIVLWVSSLIVTAPSSVQHLRVKLVANDFLNFKRPLIRQNNLIKEVYL
jgi:hypothetical protein